jgi:hypothetical protein
MAELVLNCGIALVWDAFKTKNKKTKKQKLDKKKTPLPLPSSP